MRAEFKREGDMSTWQSVRSAYSYILLTSVFLFLSIGLIARCQQRGAAVAVIANRDGGGNADI